jgi:hypothetical protein
MKKQIEEQQKEGSWKNYTHQFLSWFSSA